MFRFIFLLSLFLTFNTYAAGNLGAHVHGSASLDLAVEGKELLIMFKSPADSILGFEHLPKNPTEKKLVLKEKERWQKNFFELMGGSFKNCKAKGSTWEQKATGAKHSEVLAEMLLECPEKLSGREFEIALRIKYPKIETLHIQLIRGDGSAFSKKSTAKKIKIKL